MVDGGVQELEQASEAAPEPEKGTEARALTALSDGGSLVRSAYRARQAVAAAGANFAAMDDAKTGSTLRGAYLAHLFEKTETGAGAGGHGVDILRQTYVSRAVAEVTSVARKSAAGARPARKRKKAKAASPKRAKPAKRGAAKKPATRGKKATAKGGSRGRGRGRATRR